MFRPLKDVASGLIVVALSLPAAAQSTQENMIGAWSSMACELRPGSAGENGVMQSTWLRRTFTYREDRTFTGVTTLFVDPLCNTALASFSFDGEYALRGDHPLIEGARKIDYHLNSRFEVTPELGAFADQMNELPEALCGPEPWELGVARSIFKINCMPFGLSEGETLKDFDLIYIPDDAQDFLFMGARHVDGRGFNSEADLSSLI